MRLVSNNNFYIKLSNSISGKMFLDEPMLNHTSFNAGGPVDCLIIPLNYDDIYNTAKFCKDKNIDLYTIGAGTNILLPDEGIRGVILKIDSTMDELVFTDTKIKAGAGLKIQKLIKEAKNNNLEGIEFLAGIPGTIGGVTCMNAGIGNQSIGMYIDSGTIFDPVNLIIDNFKKSDFMFDYRFSAIQKNIFIILDINLSLKHGDLNEISQRIQNNLEKRIKTQPLSYPNAGCIWKNPSNAFAAKLIEDAGLKGFSIGGASISKMHANFIINEKNALSRDIYNLINHVEEVVYNKFNIKLEREIKIIGSNWF